MTLTTISVTSHLLATGHSASGHSSGSEGFVEKSIERIWNAVLGGAGRHFGYKFYGVIIAIAAIAAIWLWVKNHRKAAQADTQTAGGNEYFADGFGADEATPGPQRPTAPGPAGPGGFAADSRATER